MSDISFLQNKTPFQTVFQDAINGLPDEETRTGISQYNGRFRVKFLDAVVHSALRMICRFAATILSSSMIFCKRSMTVNHWKWTQYQGKSLDLSFQGVINPYKLMNQYRTPTKVLESSEEEILSVRTEDEIFSVPTSTLPMAAEERSVESEIIDEMDVEYVFTDEELDISPYRFESLVTRVLADQTRGDVRSRLVAKLNQGNFQEPDKENVREFLNSFHILIIWSAKNMGRELANVCWRLVDRTHALEVAGQHLSLNVYDHALNPVNFPILREGRIEEYLQRCEDEHGRLHRVREPIEIVQEDPEHILLERLDPEKVQCLFNAYENITDGELRSRDAWTVRVEIPDLSPMDNEALKEFIERNLELIQDRSHA